MHGRIEGGDALIDADRQRLARLRGARASAQPKRHLRGGRDTQPQAQQVAAAQLQRFVLTPCHQTLPEL